MSEIGCSSRNGVVILRGDAAHLPLPDGSVDLIVTSPPYWGKRDYRDQGESMQGQIGTEETPAEYLEALWACTREWVRVLKPEGSIFVNLDDAYSTRADGSAGRTWREDRADALQASRNTTQFVARKSLLGLPGLYAAGCTGALAVLGATDAGLRLVQRAAIIWRKNGLPESVRDRVQGEHEYLFHFTRQPRYYSACDEIRVPLAATGRKGGATAFGARNASLKRTATGIYVGQNPLGPIPGSVWDIPTEPLNVPGRIAHARCCGGRERPGCEDALDHYAAWPTGLVRPIILGWSAPGICAGCGQGRRPVIKREAASLRHEMGTSWNAGSLGLKGRVEGPRWRGTDIAATITGYACACPQSDAPTRPAVVADPFGGTGTTALVADMLGRTGVTFDRSSDYCRIAAWRTADPGERARALGVPKPPPVPDGQGSLFDAEEAS
jgi:DNA methylase